MSCAVAHDANPEEHVQAALDLQSSMDELLGDLSDPVEIIDVSLANGFEGEIYYVGPQFRAKVCIFEQKLAWVYCTTHSEHLGNVLEREVGLQSSLLTNAMKEARRRNLKLGEWLVGQGLVTMPRLRACLQAHLAAHLHALALTTGEFELAFVAQRHRYDHALTFELPEIVAHTVFRAAAEPLAFADALVIVDPRQRRVVATHGSAPDNAACDLVELGGRVSRFASAVGVAQGETVFKTDDAVFCVQPLRTHPGLALGIFSQDPAKIGLILQRAIALKGSI